jgi:outer membrane immunogenic protein
MKKLLLVGLAGLAFVGSGSAEAADVGVPVYPTAAPVIVPVPDFSWTGPYVGAIGGGGLERTQTRYSFLSTQTAALNDFEDIFGPGPPAGPGNVGGQSAVASAIAQGFLPTSLGPKTTGFFTAGAVVGMNFQMARVVFGFEGDFAWMSAKRTTVFVAPPNTAGVTNVMTQTAGIQWLDTARGRLGYTLNRALFYATGGAAIARVNDTTTATLSDGVHTDVFTAKARFAGGFTVGGGIEYAVTDYITVKAEYLFFDLGTVKSSLGTANPTGPGQGLTINARQRLDGHVFRIGLNYKPDWL